MDRKGWGYDGNMQAWKVVFLNPTGTELSWIVCIPNMNKTDAEDMDGYTLDKIREAIAAKHGWQFVRIRKVELLDRAFVVDFRDRSQEERDE